MASVARSLSFFIALLFVCQEARGCECAPPPPPCEAVGLSELVFLASVLTLTGDQIKNAKMHVDQSFKGSLPAEVELFDDGMCDGPHLEIGRQYLMYSERTRTGGIPARGCTRSRAVEYADEDLRFLEMYLEGKTGTEISGTVRFEPDNHWLSGQKLKPMRNVAMTIAGAGRASRAITDASGRYSFPDLPPGSYQLTAQRAGYLAGGRTNRIQLAANGCAVADIVMQVDRRVQGIIRSRDGRPVAGALVELIPAHERSKWWENPILLSESDDEGLYTIDGIPPGDYHLGINIGHTPTKKSPYSPTYYPNTPDARTALPIKFQNSASVQSYDLTAPARLRVISVQGRITGAADEAPKVRPEVRIEQPGLRGQIETVPIKVDSEGRFEIELCEGVRYSGFAFAGAITNLLYSEPVEFIASGTELHFVLNKTPQEFMQSRRKFER